MSQANKDLARRSFEIGMTGDLAQLDQVYAQDVIYHGPDGELRGLDAVRETIAGYRNALSDMTVTILDQVADGDSVVTRLQPSGTFTGPMGDIQPTGETVTLDLTLSLMHIKGGRIAEEWEVFDRMEMMQKLGAMPAEGAQAPA